jgi:hypothetical protein
VGKGNSFACLPTAVTRITGRSGKRSNDRQLKEAHNAIGGGSSSRGVSKRNFNCLHKSLLYELEEGVAFSNSETMVRSNCTEDDEPNTIGV